MALYLDTSALVKLVIREPESGELRAFVGEREVVSCHIARTELIRAIARHEPDSLTDAEDLIAETTLIALNRQLTAQAAWMKPPTLRSLDALHVATAASLTGDLEALVSYDRRMLEAGQMAGLPVASPGMSAA